MGNDRLYQNNQLLTKKINKYLEDTDIYVLYGSDRPSALGWGDSSLNGITFNWVNAFGACRLDPQYFSEFAQEVESCIRSGGDPLDCPIDLADFLSKTDTRYEQAQLFKQSRKTAEYEQSHELIKLLNEAVKKHNYYVRYKDSQPAEIKAVSWHYNLVIHLYFSGGDCTFDPDSFADFMEEFQNSCQYIQSGEDPLEHIVDLKNIL